MTSQDLVKLIAQGEGDRIEFKRARGGVPADFWPTYGAFANTDGGTIILGVREQDGRREVEGLADVEKTIQALGGDDFFTRLSLRSSRVSGASWRTHGPNPSRSRKGDLHLARLQREASDDISPAIGRAFDG